MPGRASLQAAQYYAHPRNAFWPIMERLYGIARSAPYPERLSALSAAGVALWDVLESCERATSLDSDIVAGSATPNDLAAFLHRHRGVRAIYFNGQPARQLFERLVAPALDARAGGLPRFTLPSTSPANARLTTEQKLQAWTVLKAPLRPQVSGRT